MHKNNRDSGDTLICFLFFPWSLLLCPLFSLTPFPSLCEYSTIIWKKKARKPTERHTESKMILIDVFKFEIQATIYLLLRFRGIGLNVAQCLLWTDDRQIAGNGWGTRLFWNTDGAYRFYRGRNCGSMCFWRFCGQLVRYVILWRLSENVRLGNPRNIDWNHGR